MALNAFSDPSCPSHAKDLYSSQVDKAKRREVKQIHFANEIQNITSLHEKLYFYLNEENTRIGDIFNACYLSKESSKHNVTILSPDLEHQSITSNQITHLSNNLFVMLTTRL